MHGEIWYQEELEILRHLVAQELRLHAGNYNTAERNVLQDLIVKIRRMHEVAPSGKTPGGQA